jgi:hypothetical protein
MLLLSGSTILPMFMLWSHLCDAIHQLQKDDELRETFWIKPERSWKGTHQLDCLASTEVGQAQRVGRSS